MTLFTGKEKQRFLVGSGIGLIIGLMLSAMLYFNWFSTWQMRSTDFLYQGREPSGKTVIVAVDDKSLERIGRWASWPRSIHVQLLEILNQANPRVIGLDVIFADEAAGDEDLAEAIANAGNVVQPLAGVSTSPSIVKAGQAVRFDRFLKPLPSLREVSLALGHANVLPDDDGVVRRLPLTIESRGERYPAFALAVLSEFLRLPPQDYIPQRGYVDFGGRRIPVDQFNRTFINYVGPPNSIPIYSYVDVLNGQVDTSVFNDKMVLVGIMATAEPDSYVTPTSVEKMFGVELHANVIETVLQSRFLQTQNLSGQMAVVILMSLLAGIVFPQVRPVRSTFFVLLFLAAYLLISFFSFDAGLILNLVYPFLALTLTYIAILLYRYFYEERRRRAITKLFGRYVSPEVVGAVLDSFDKGTLQLGGTNRVATVLFADIRGFTSMSEKLPPQELMNTLNDYLSIMVEIIFKYEGTVNKFIGDNVMAMWNAPLDQPDHALRAVKAAVDMQREIEARQRQNNKIPKVGFGIGINTGPMVAGNVGSQERLEYTVIGDTVNLASRLCGAAASGQVLISPETHQLVKDEIVGHRLTPMKFKGKEKPIAVYEVLRYQIR